ncbi:MAG: Periplasmic serine endoprotease DegP precursor [Planctomycetota bacterium]|jgi:hypothetical protein
MRFVLAMLIATFTAAAAGATCDNCHGSRVVGPGPVRFACPVCEGTGEVSVVEHPPVVLSDAEAAGQPRPVVARVTSANGNLRHSGSGVLVAASGSTATVLTNWHVVDEARDGITVAWPDGSRAAAKLIAHDRVWDLAALVVARPVAEPVALAAQAPKIGDRLTIAGWGPKGVYLEQTGAVIDYVSPRDVTHRQIVEMRAAARNGDSGGPMFNADGELAGVLFGHLDGRTFGSCSTRVAAFLEGARVAAAPAPSRAVCADGRCQTR